MLSAIGMIGYWARSFAPAMNIGICGPGTFDTTRLIRRVRTAARAAIAWIVGGAHVPMFIRNSAATA